MIAGSKEYFAHRCTECGNALEDHALEIRDDGVVVAGSYTGPNDFTVCCDRALAKLTDELLAYHEGRP